SSDDSSYRSYECGRTLLNDKFMFLDIIQKGSFGKVTLALDVNTNCKVAIKAMCKRPVSQSVARHEIRILQKLGLDNPHICHLLESFETEEHIVLVLEYCARGDLYELIHSDSILEAADIWKIAREMYSGIKHAHSLGIFHRDLKPENILFTECGSVKICDWGLSSRSLNTTVPNIGTEKYMAPEFIFSAPKDSISTSIPKSYNCKAADYWSFGITLLTAIFKRSPFKAMSSNIHKDEDLLDNHQASIYDKKSLRWDSNFQKFVLYNTPEILYDIYPDMSQNCFNIFMSLLKTGGLEDDSKSFQEKIQLRNLENFIIELEKRWKFGFTVWDEDEHFQDYDNIGISKSLSQESFFDMDDVLQGTNDRMAATNTGGSCRGASDNSFSPINTSNEETRFENSSYPGSKTFTIPVPSLTGSSYQPKSWYDLDDEVNEKEMGDLISTL
ncbi:kinase-like protein, partial [Metschnikowia bicuspidata var. bicuspidata NRRL YB-4993]